MQLTEHLVNVVVDKASRGKRALLLDIRMERNNELETQDPVQVASQHDVLSRPLNCHLGLF